MGLDAPADRRTLWPTALIVLVAAFAWLALHAPLFEIDQWHIHGRFTDQAGYVTTARGLLDTGHLRNGIVYPAYLHQPDWRPYMPGHYLTLAASFAAFGWSPLTAVLPSLGAFLLGSLGTFWIGQRIHSKRVGLLAALLFLLHPGMGAYAFTAMAELTFTAAGVLAVGLWLALPPRLRPWCLAPALALPFLYRETGALLILPLLGLLWAEPATRSWKAAGGASAAAVLLLFGLQAWQVAEGKGSIPLTWITHRAFNYVNAFPEPGPELSARELFAAMSANAGRNVELIGSQLRKSPMALEVVGFWLGLVVAGLGLAQGLRRGRRDRFALGAGTLALVVLGLAFFLYDVKAHKGMRGMLFVLPFTSIAAMAWFEGLELGSRPIQRGLALTALVGSALFSHLTLRRAAGEWTADDERSARAIEQIRTWKHDETRLFLCDFALSNDFIGYAVEAYPMPWSFLPVTDETLHLLLDQYTPGTMLLRDSRQGSLLTREAIESHGLSFRGTFEWQGEPLAVFQR